MTFDLEKSVNDAIAKSLESGAIDKMVTDNVNKAVASAFAEQFGHYSTFTKVLKEAVAGALTFDPNSFEIERYHLMIRNVVKKRIQEKMTNEFAVELDKLLADLHQPVPAEMKLSELVAAFVEHFEKDHARNRAEQVSVKVENTDYGYSTITLRPDGGSKRDTYSSWSEMVLQLNKDGVVYSIWIRGHQIDKQFFLSHTRGFERLILGLYMQKSKIVMDAYDCFYKEEPEHQCEC